MKPGCVFSFQRHFDVNGYGTKCRSKTLVREISTMVNAEKAHRFWNALALLFFVSVCAISFALVLSRGDMEIERLGFFDLVLLGLATIPAHSLDYV